MKDFVAQFKQQVYPALLKRLIADTAQLYRQEEERLAEKFVSDIEREIERVGKLQRNGLPPATELLLSLTYTSVYFGKPAIRLDFYHDAWITSQASYSTYIDAVPLFAHWERHLADLDDATKELRAVVRRTHLESLRQHSVRALGYLISTQVKYWIRRLRHTSALAALQTGPEFYISYGEYMDWQKAILARLPEIDIFNSGTADSLRLREFHQCCYSHKKFDELDLGGSVFTECTFENCTFHAVDLCDTVFENCHFGHIQMDAVRLSGARFVDTILKNTSITAAEAAPEAQSGGRQDLYRPLTFDGCALEAIALTECNFVGAQRIECLCKEINIAGNGCENSDFAAFISAPPAREDA